MVQVEFGWMHGGVWHELIASHPLYEEVTEEPGRQTERSSGGLDLRWEGRESEWERQKTEAAEAAAALVAHPLFAELTRREDLEALLDEVAPEMSERRSSVISAAAAQTRDALVERLAAEIAANEAFRRARGRAAQNDVANRMLPQYVKYPSYPMLRAIDRAIVLAEPIIATEAHRLNDGSRSKKDIALALGVTMERLNRVMYAYPKES